MSTTTLIDLLRHGQPEGGRRYRGSLDDPLSESGWQQMRHAASGETPWNRITSSPLTRCCDFARELADRLQIPLQIESDLRELGYGEWEGKSPDQLRELDGERYQAYFHDPATNQPPGAEPLQQFIDRVSTSYHRLIRQHPGEHLLLVAHAGVIRAIISESLMVPSRGMSRLHIETGQLSRIRIESGRPPTLLFHNRPKL